MQIFLSWQQKFRLLIVITLLGLGLITATSFWASRQVNAALQARENATAFAGASSALINDWLKLGILRRELTPANSEEFLARIGALEQLVEQFVSQAHGLDDSAIGQSAEQIEALILAETGQQRNWLALSQQLGLTPFQGQRQALSVSAQQLEAITIGLIQPLIAAALSNQRNYLSTFDSDYAAQTQSAIGELQAKVQELDWGDNQIGQTVVAFSAAFAQADESILQLRSLEAQLAEQRQQTEQRVGQQNLMLQDGLLASTAQQAQRARHSANWLMGLTSLCVTLLLLVTLSQASRTLMAQLHKVTRLLTQVASGDLTDRLAIGGNPKDEFNQLGETCNRMIQGIGRILCQVVEANRALTELHAYLGVSMRDLGDNSRQVEIQTEQAASASQQICATINEMAQRTSDVGNSTHSAYESARLGSTVIDASVDNMRWLSQLIQQTHAQVALLSQSSGKVHGIIDVINSLADQTNLLALNAAIEAARAGDAGRGFSVVADEVRSLAQKTVSATTDIARIIGDFNQQTQSIDGLMSSGLALAAQSEEHAGQVATAIETITLSMEQLSGEMNQVVVAIEEISSTTGDIAEKMEEINLHTGQTKGLRLTLEQQTHSLSEQIQVLSQSARQFQIG
ncbi:MAG: methyl-accepting chemotaxis protein [Pseudomonas sp.]|uniref:methyl-accepting chemotaxis protein n=1 Tax=Pseudomonas sp. TaxID=306 RepID=UPI003BB6FC35